jgi:hypothetical protein
VQNLAKFFFNFSWHCWSAGHCTPQILVIFGIFKSVLLLVICGFLRASSPWTILSLKGVPLLISPFYKKEPGRLRRSLATLFHFMAKCSTQTWKILFHNMRKFRDWLKIIKFPKRIQLHRVSRRVSMLTF